MKSSQTISYLNVLVRRTDRFPIFQYILYSVTDCILLTAVLSLEPVAIYSINSVMSFTNLSSLRLFADRKIKSPKTKNRLPAQWKISEEQCSGGHFPHVASTHLYRKFNTAKQLNTLPGLQMLELICSLQSKKHILTSLVLSFSYLSRAAALQKLFGMWHFLGMSEVSVPTLHLVPFLPLLRPVLT